MQCLYNYSGSNKIDDAFVCFFLPFGVIFCEYYLMYSAYVRSNGELFNLRTFQKHQPFTDSANG